MSVFFVRHGVTIINQQGRLQGLIDFPLSEQGYEQAVSVSMWARSLDACSKVITSDLSRAFETAKIISLKNGIPLVPCRLLRERDLFDFELVGISEVGRMSGHNEMAATVDWGWRQYIMQDEILASRVNYLISQIEEERNPLLVSHAGVISAFIKSKVRLEKHIHIPAGGIVEYDLLANVFNLIIVDADNETHTIKKIQ